jgi:D-glucuronyl C5-epimerase C-terminus
VSPGLSQAASITVLGRDGHVFVRNDPALAAEPIAPAVSFGAGAGPTVPRARTADGDVRSELARLFHTHQIDGVAFRRYSGNFQDALDTVRRLTGTRAAELDAVIENLHGVAAAGLLTPSRLPALFLTLEVNRQWWTKGPLLASGQRVGFPGSQIVWEYYPGQGIELQELGSWGQADWMYEAGPKYWRRLRNLVDELIPLAVRRGGGLAWEYYFNFDGGTPPWTSAMSQGTALQALTQAWEASGDDRYLNVARESLPIFSDGPPVGVSVGTSLGRRYLLYSFAPDPSVAVINGFLQTLIGLFDYAKATRDPRGWRLFHSCDAEARAELPRYDTGSWSMYQPGVLDTRDYHILVTGFLQQLCSRTHAPIYCVTAAHFERYLKHPPPSVSG